MESIICPYQGLFIDFSFSGHIFYDKDGKMLPSNCEYVEGLNEESA